MGQLERDFQPSVNEEEWRAPTAEARSRSIGPHRSEIDAIKANPARLSIYTLPGQSHRQGPESGAKRLSTMNASNQSESLKSEQESRNLPDIEFRGTKTYRPWYLLRIILNQINHKIARRNIRQFPQLAIFSFDNIGLTINLEGRYERDILDALSRFLTEHLRIDTDTAVLDVGANIGNHSVFFSEIFSKVYAFEPNPQAYYLLQYNSAGSNIVPLNYGLSSENSTVPFSIDPINLGGSRVIDGYSSRGAPRLNTIDIEVRRLDDNLQIKNQVVSLIKIDVEGHELQVLEGAAESIRTSQPVIVFEQSRDVICEGTSDAIDFLRERNYRFFTIQSNFHLGLGYTAMSISLLLRLFFGFRKEFVPTHHFRKKFYEMIIAVPTSRD